MKHTGQKAKFSPFHPCPAVPTSGSDCPADETLVHSAGLGYLLMSPLGKGLLECGFQCAQGKELGLGLLLS